MAITYDATAVGTEAKEWIRWRLGDTKTDRAQLDDDEITAALLRRDLTATSDPFSNSIATHLAAIDCCKAKAAALGDQSEIVMSEVGAVKSTAAEFYLKLCIELQAEISVSNAGPKFANPKSYSTTHVTGVDAVPDEE